MPLQPFVFPFPETRLLDADGLIYKFEIRPGNNFRCVNFKPEDSFHDEFEEIIRTVLGNLNNLVPFFSTHYTVYPYKKPWRNFNEPSLNRQRVYPHVLVLRLEKNGIQMKKKKAPQHVPFSLALKPKRRRTDSPLEEAILKELAEDMEARPMPSLAGKVDVGNKHAEEEVTEGPAHVAQKTTKEDDKTEDTGNTGDEEENETEDEEEEEEDDEEAPVKGGFLTRLVSSIFPFSLFSRNHS